MGSACVKFNMKTDMGSSPRKGVRRRLKKLAVEEIAIAWPIEKIIEPYERLGGWW